MPKDVFSIGIRLATEASRGTQPPDTMWFQGGRWMDVVTDGTPDVANRRAIIFPAGHAGRRAMNQQAPVRGRAWSDGNFTANAVADFLGLIFHAALGNASTDAKPSTDPELLTDEEFTGQKEMVLGTQPSDGGAVLLFDVTGLTSSGTIYTQGVDVYGEGASETITLSSAGSYYTRTSFSAIGASSLSVNVPDNSGSLTVYGFKGWEHTFSASAQNPTYSIQKLGDAQTGNADASAFSMNGVVLQNFTLNAAAGDREGILSIDTTWEGDPGTASPVDAIGHASPMRIWPAWAFSATRDGTNWHKITNLSLDMNAGNRNYRAGAGTANPQGTFYGGQEVTGNMDVLVEDNAEYDRWQGASRMTLVFDLTPEWLLTTASKMNVSASLSAAYFENVTPGEDDEAQSLSIDFRTIDDADDGILKIFMRNGVPGTGYENVA